MKMREPFLSEMPVAFCKIPNRSGGAGRERGEGGREFPPRPRFPKKFRGELFVTEILTNFCFFVLPLLFSLFFCNVRLEEGQAGAWLNLYLENQIPKGDETMEAKDRIIVALDVDSLDKAKSLVESLAPHVGCFKVGLELLTAVGGPKVVEFVHSLGGQVFYDGKFDDIPNTVGGAAKAVAGLNVKMFNVHASAGVEAMMAAVANKGQALVLAVTVLTSLEENNAHLIFGGPSKAKVLQLARDAKIAGCDGIICSPQELELLGKQKELGSLLKVTPGVRPEWAAAGDQKRIMTPAEAIRAGATALVIGRPITKPPAEIGAPVDAAKKIAEEISAVL